MHCAHYSPAFFSLEPVPTGSLAPAITRPWGAAGCEFQPCSVRHIFYQKQIRLLISQGSSCSSAPVLHYLCTTLGRHRLSEAYFTNQPDVRFALRASV